MIEKLKRLFAIMPKEGDQDKANKPLEIAVTALLVQAAYLDDQFDGAEHAAIVSLIAQQFEMSVEAATTLVAEVAENDTESAGFYRYSQIIRAEMDHEQRLSIMEMLWQVVYADAELHDHEASLMRRMAGLLYISDQESGLLRQRVRKNLKLA